MNIYLIGYRCTGKTTVGRLLAQKLRWQILDSDIEIVKEQGIPISEIVERQGWVAFRRMEKNMIQKLSLLDRHVIATGGGVILNNENVYAMKKSGKLVWLRAKPETIHERMAMDADTENSRPALTDKGIFEEIEETLKIRNPIYETAMDIDIPTDQMAPEDICSIIQEKLVKNIHRPDKE